MTHISYKTAKALKEFCPELPEPMAMWYYDGPNRATCKDVPRDGLLPQYELHDLLSREFCEAFAKQLKGFWPGGVHATLADQYWEGGLPAVEAELARMMGVE